MHTNYVRVNVKWRKKIREATLAARLSILFDKLHLAIWNACSVKNFRDALTHFQLTKLLNL